MSEYAWADLRARAVERFHDTPRAETEQRILDVFRDHPAFVAEAIEHVAARFAAGQIRSPWPVLAVHVEGATRPLENVTASDTADRQRRTEKAEQWLRAAGKHFDSEDEVLDELFDASGGDRHGPLLKPWRDEEMFRKRMVVLWRELRPEGVLIEQQAEERGRRWRHGPVAASGAPET
jgi:hypothetical protein